MNQLFNQVIQTDVGLVRKANEDSAGFAPSSELHNNGDLFVVCDGMGGHIGGAIASSTAVKCLLDFFRNKFYENPYVALNDAIIFTNEQIYARSCAESDLKGMGTTCCVLLIRNSEAFIAHVGDSRIYFHSSGKIHRVTRDHSFVQNLVDQGLISDSEAESHPRKNEILRALGIKADVQPEISSQPIHPKKGDKFLLCSDGLSGLVQDNTIEKILSSVSGLESKADELIALANGGGGFDNITVAIIEMLQSPFKKSVFVDYNPINRNEATGQIHSMAATQEIAPNKKEIPIWKQPKFLFTLCGLLALVVLIYFWQSVGEGDSKTHGNLGDTAEVENGGSDKEAETPANKNCTNDTIGLIKIKSKPESPNTMSGALGLIKKEVDYDADCLRYFGKSGLKEKEVNINHLNNVQPGDKLWLDCECIQGNKSRNGPSSNDSDKKPSLTSNNTNEPTNRTSIQKDTSRSNLIIDTTTNKSN